MYDPESSAAQALPFHEQQVEFGAPSFTTNGDDDYYDSLVNLDLLAQTYAFTILIFVVPFVLHVAVGCFGCVHEYFKGFSPNMYKEMGTRARRREFIGFQLTHLCILYDLVLLDTILGFGLLPVTDETQFLLQDQLRMSPGYLTIAYYLLTLGPCFVVKARRLHDTGRSAWWVLLEFFPVVSVVPTIIMWFLDSQAETNVYGPNPKAKVTVEELSVFIRTAEADILEEGLVTFRGVDSKRESLLPEMVGYKPVRDVHGPSLAMAGKV